MSDEDSGKSEETHVHGGDSQSARDPQRRRERQARVILDEMYQFVALLDARGHILEVNKPALDGVGYTLEEVVGRPLWEVECWQVTPETPERIRQEVQRAIREGFARFEMEMFGANAGQEVVTLDISFKPLLDEHGRVAYVLGEGRNITEKKAAEAQVARQNEELRRLYERLRDFDRLKTQFFANVSHELRTPLALILGPVRRRLEAGGLTDEGRHDLEVVERNARTLLRHVNDLLDLSKLEAGQMEARRAGVDLARLTRFVASHFEVLAEERAVRLSVEAPESLPARVDPPKVQRILLNLLSNAFKFTPRGGAIRLRLHREGGRAVFAVEDTGPGVPPAQREAVFERFRQVEGGTNRRHGGTGLGLAIVKEFVSLHGGEVRVGEASGGGAAFAVEIPTQAPGDAGILDAEVGGDDDSGRQVVEELRTHRADRIAEDVSAGRESPLVLVVEDHPEMNAFVAETLAEGHRVARAFDGREGLEKAVALRPDLIVSDVMMPGMGGDELVREVRGRRELDGIPIPLLTAKADEELRVLLLKEGAQDYLDKPFAAEELRARAARLIAERRRAEAELRRSDDLLRAVAEGVPDAVFVKDQHGRYLMINAAGARMLGRSVGEVVGREDRELLDPATARRLSEDDARVMAGGAPLSFEDRITAAGSTRTFLSTKAPYRDREGRVVGVIGIARDITERKRAEEELREAKEAAEAAGRAKDRFLAVLSHELRTPLTPVLATISYVEAMPDLPAELREEIVSIRRNVETEARLIDDLLDVTRISRGDLQLQREPVDAHAVLRAALEVCQPDIEAKGLELTLVLRAREHHVFADPARLQQVYWNLIKNAVKFTPPRRPRHPQLLERRRGRGTDDRGLGHRRRDRAGVPAAGLRRLRAVGAIGVASVRRARPGADRRQVARRPPRRRDHGRQRRPRPGRAVHGGAGDGAGAGREAAPSRGLAPEGRPGAEDPVRRGQPRHPAVTDPPAACLGVPGRAGGERAGGAGRGGPRTVRPAGQRHRAARRQRAGGGPARLRSLRGAGDRLQRLRHRRGRAGEPGGGVRAPPGQAHRLRHPDGPDSEHGG